MEVIRQLSLGNIPMSWIILSNSTVVVFCAPKPNDVASKATDSDKIIFLNIFKYYNKIE